MTNTDGYGQGRRPFDRGAELQAEIDAAFPLSTAVAVEANVWNTSNNYVFEPPLSNTGVIAIGWTSQAIRQSHLAFNDCDSELRESLVLHVRTAFEHAIYAMFQFQSFETLVSKCPSSGEQELVSW